MTAPHWSADRMVAIDTETTGVSVHEDRIVTAAAVHIVPGRRPHVLTWVIDPGIDIPEAASDVHGWTREKLDAHLGGRQATHTMHGATRPITRDVAIFEIATQIAGPMSRGSAVVAFNAAFDLSMLEAECVRNDVPTLSERLAPKGLRGVVDPFCIDKHYSRRKGSRKLADQVTHYQVMLTGAHTADADALAAARLIPRMVATYPELGKHTLGWLYQKQIEWRAEQQASLAAYFDRKGIGHDGCCGSWPLHGSCCAPVTAGVSS